jgi:hypothetical protein
VLRGAVWSEEEQFWRTAVAEAPRSAKAHQCLGTVLLQRARRDRDARALGEAERVLEAGLDIDGDYAVIWDNLGQISMVRAEWNSDPEIRLAALEEAISRLERAALPREEYVGSHLRLASALYLSAAWRGDAEARLAVLDRYRALIRDYPRVRNTWEDLHLLLTREGLAAEAASLEAEFARVYPGEALGE